MDTRTDSTVPGPVSVGPEMDALGRFYQDVTWKGVIHEGGMGPGTPAMTGVGHSTSQVIQDGRWIMVDSEQDQYLEDGTFVLKWQLHWVSGWDPEHGEYRAVMADNYGHADVYRRAGRGRPPGLRIDTGHRAPAALHLGCRGPGRHHLAERNGRSGRVMVPYRGIHHGAATAVTIRLSRHTQPDVPRSPDDQDRAVGEVNHLVRRAAQDQARQVAAAA